MKIFSKTEPIYVGFVGQAGTGKTFTAKSIVPSSVSFFYHDPLRDIVWDHQWLSLPLYEIYNIRTQTIGGDVKNRILYAIHEVVSSVLKNNVAYDDMIELVYDLYTLEITNREGEKPRTFLQKAGDLFLKNNLNCFINSSKYKIINAQHKINADYDLNEMEYPWFIGIISDVRQTHEAKVIHEQRNNLLIKFEASKEALQERLLKRDGISLSETEASHRTENEIDKIPYEWYDLVLDTSLLTKEEQVSIVKNFILSHIKEV